MSFEDDDELLQDFLVEAGEILEVLSEQLVDLEQRPEDMDLLNAIFRGFHTVKGGAGFLQLDPMVDCCHIAENVFDLLRTNKRSVDAELMDVMLVALDSVNHMFADVRGGNPPTPAAASLMVNLVMLACPTGGAPNAADLAKYGGVEMATISSAAAAPQTAPPPSAAPPAAQTPVQDASANKEISDDEFEALLDELHGDSIVSGIAESDSPAAPVPPAADDDLFDMGGDDLFAEPSGPATSASTDEITNEEFEALLDKLHGEGVNTPAAEPEVTAAPAQPQEVKLKTGANEEISDDDFEDLLDQLHGKGAGPTAVTSPAPEVAQVTTPVAIPAPVAAAPAVSIKPTPEPIPAAAPPPPPRPPKDTGKGAAPPGGAPAGGAAAAAEVTVRVDTKRLDEIMNMVGELVLVRNRLVRLGLESADEEMAKAVANLDVVTGDLQTSVMKTRMQPIKKVFGRFPRVVRDLARTLRKEVNLEMQGEDTDLDKNLVEALADPLVHLVRNSVDHGIEQPDDREENNKPRVGKILLGAEQEGDHILLTISDDGAGMDPNKLREIAISKGLFEREAADRLSDTECFNLIFAPGFSTRDEISDVSGRGVGMDVVKTKITQLNGTVEIDSVLGEGTRIAIKVPLTLAIMPTLMVMLGDQTFALPLVSVNEIFHLDLTRTNIVDGQEVIIVREKALPLFHLKRWLIEGVSFNTSAGKTAENSAENTLESSHVVIVSVGTQRVGFVVDQLIGQEEVVIKPLGKMLHGTPGMAGATITGDGTIALILDVPSMLNKYVGNV